MPSSAEEGISELKNLVKKLLYKGIFYGSLLLMAFLSVPAVLSLVPLALVWTLTDKLLRRLEGG